MKFKFIMLAMCLYTLSLQAQADADAIKDIQVVCSYYLDGGTRGDSVLFSKAFIPSGQMNYMRNDTLMNVSLQDFMTRTRNTGRVQNRTTKIENIQVYGNVASAKLTIEYPTFFFHDIMSLLKTKEGWRIVGKIFYREEKSMNAK